MTKTEDSKKYKVVTLGCRTNQYESQAYADQLKELGYTAAGEGENAEVCIVNTCTVTEAADTQSRYEVRQLARKHPNAKLVVTGCAAENNPDQIKTMAGVTHLVSNKNKENLIAELFPLETTPEFQIKNFDSHTRAFVKVQDGCNSYCTYCIIPYVRGRSRSRTLIEIITEVEGLVATGYKEVVITGINVGDFDGNVPEGNKAYTLADLIRAVDSVKGLARLRVSSIDPDEVTEDLASAILDGKTTCHSMHIVLQSGSNVILKRMNRKYTRQIFMDTVDRLRAADPDFTFTTDIIVGFPGETDADFKDTLDVMDKVKFAKVHMFPFSERARTRAALMPNKVPGDVIKARKQEVLRFAEKISYELHERFVGRTMDVLLENKQEGLCLSMEGHTENFLRVLVEGEALASNSIVKVKFISNTPQGLVGVITPVSAE
ncbi:MAG: tRNA (N(6)-L-threonylcarbamoyladenosine(37)-C(2))-methylthiotransferase MtaB [Parachlamydiaceae bacterium]|nr:tRNA (N(6)-L-threonylcarbamoyladenosine(37)-C(2))-methylthiotransferase MtaB [Parachlamydiaceae bacterium]